jgi:hypothetical protein
VEVGHFFTSLHYVVSWRGEFANPNTKGGETAMVYTKPQLVGYSALAVIQNGGSAKNDIELESDNQTPSVPAYQADE